MKKHLLGAVASMAIVAFAAPATAQAGPDGDVVQVWGQLEESLATELERYGSRVEIVTDEQVENGGFNDTSQALQMLVPGLYVSPKSGAFDYVKVSLLGGRRIDQLWLVDGVRVSNRLYTTTTPLDTIPAHMIEKIEVLKGGQSLFYGTSAMAGAINIVTKGFTADQRGSFGVGADTNGGMHVFGDTSGGVGDHRFVLYASHDEADGFQPIYTDDYQPSATDRERGYDVTTIGAKYGFEFSELLKFSAAYQHSEATLDFAEPDTHAASFNERDEDVASLKVDWSPTADFDLFAKAYYHWWDARITTIDNTVPPSNVLTASQDALPWGFEDYGVNLLGQYQLNDAVTILGGVDYQNYSGADASFFIAEQTEDVIAPFAQVRWDLDLLQGLNLAAGVRTNIPSAADDTTIWDLSGNLQITDYIYGRARVGTNMRLPDAYELYVADPCCEQGNPELVGEESMNYELAFGGRSNTVSWEITGFRREIDDIIQIVTVPDTRPPGLPGNFSCTDDPVNGCFDTFDNSGRPVETTGAEFTVTWQITDAISGTFDWTHTEAEFEASSLQLQDIPVDAVKAILDWAPSDAPFGAGLTVNHVGEIYSDPPGGALGLVEHGDYAIVDLNARWYLDADRRQRIVFRAENLFDEDYVSQVLRGDIDITGVDYNARHLGTPQTFHVSYLLDF